MSIIFSGLERADQEGEDTLNWYYFDVTSITSIEGELNPTSLQIDTENEILLNQCFETEYIPYQHGSTEVITTNEKYLVNGQKNDSTRKCGILCASHIFLF